MVQLANPHLAAPPPIQLSGNALRQHLQDGLHRCGRPGRSSWILATNKPSTSIGTFWGVKQGTEDPSLFNSVK